MGTDDIPSVTATDDICVLNQTGYSLGYSNNFRAPVWLTMQLQNQSVGLKNVLVSTY